MAYTRRRGSGYAGGTHIDVSSPLAEMYLRTAQRHAGETSANSLVDAGSVGGEQDQECRRLIRVVPLVHHLMQSFGSSQVRLGGLQQTTFAQIFDFVSGAHGQIKALVNFFSVLLHEASRSAWRRRLLHVQPPTSASSSIVACIIFMDMEEPQLDVMSWLDMLCLELRVGLVLVWSWAEAAAFLEGPFNDAGVSRGFDANAAPIPILAAALGQTPALLSRQDVVRATNRVSTVADLLLLGQQELASLPGIGAKKVRRITGVFHAAFPSTQPHLRDILVPDAERPSTDAPTLAPVEERQRSSEESQSLASHAVMQPKRVAGGAAFCDALQRMRDAEDMQESE